MKIFEFAIIEHPTEDQRKAGGSSKLLVLPTAILAKDQAGAAMLAGRALPDNVLDHLDRVEVAVRPF